jgi:anti-sigma B factor antagonist
MAMTLEIDPPIDARNLGDAPGAPPFQMSVHESDDGVVMVVEGELDMSTAPTLREALVDVTEGLAGNLILDVRLLTFIDSSGLTLFVAEHKKLRSLGHDLVIFAPTPRTRRLLEIAGLDELLTVRPST